MTFSILNLPVELLTTILEMAAEGGVSEYPNNRATLSLVTRRFYSIIRDTPSFWTRIFGDYPLELNALALARSRNAPIEITFNLLRIDNTAPVPSFKAAVHHLERWRSVALEFKVGDQNSLLQLLVRPAPLLEEAAISIVGYMWADEMDSVDLFAGQADRLQTLRLSQTIIPWDSDILRGLRTLDLQDIQDSALTFEDLMHILASSPQLACLTLRSLALPHPVTGSNPISLPHLQDLDLGNIGFSVEVTKHLLRHIQSPSCRSLAFELGVDDPSNITELFKLLHPFVPTSLSGEGNACLEVTQNTLKYSLKRGPAARLRVYLYRLSPFTHIPAFISILPPDILAILTRLYLHGIKNPDQLAPALVALDRLHVANLTMGDLGNGSNIILQKLGEKQDGEWLYPALDELFIEMINVAPGSLARMIQARYGDTNPPLPLTRLAIIAPDSIHAPELPVVRKFMADGVLVWAGRLDRPVVTDLEDDDSEDDESDFPS